jgi:soluble lytic murein transglycosylase-like protein
MSELEKAVEKRFDRLDGSLSSLATSPMCPDLEKELTYYKVFSMKKGISKRVARDISSSVVKYSRLYGKETDLILSVIAAESDFNPKAVSPTGAVGLMQVMPFWKKELGIPCDLKSVDCNIRYGVHILKTYGSRYEDLEYTLAAYNRGPLAVLRDVESGNPVGDYYTKRVLDFKNKLERME